MRFGKTFALAGALMACSGAFAAEGTRTREILPDLAYGFEAMTGYSTNANSSPTDPEETFMVTFRPFLRYEKEFAFGPLSLSYDPEMRWYESRTGDDTEWDHIFNFDTTLKLTPTVTLDIRDTYSNVDSENIAEVGGVTVGGDNAYDSNVFNADLTWKFKTGQEMVAGYTNEYLEYDSVASEYRNNVTNEVYVGYNRNVSSATKLGVKLSHGAANFYDSRREELDENNNPTGVYTDRDQEWTRLLLTSELRNGPWQLTTDFGVEYYRITSDVVDTVNKSVMEPYLNADLNYIISSTHMVSAAYVYRTVPGYREDQYFAKQSQFRLSYNYDFSTRLHFDAYGVYDNLSYDKDFDRTGLNGDSRDEWMRFGFKFLYNMTQDLDVVLGYSRDELLNGAGDNEEYSINRYDVGLKYTF